MAMDQMHAMRVESPGQPLKRLTRPIPVPGSSQLLVEVLACGVCRTDLHVVDGEVAARYPVIPGHEIVGRVIALGSDVEGFALGQRIGIPWLASTCGTCDFCIEGRENLCDAPSFTGCTCDGGFATHAIADAGYCFALPSRFSDADAAPLLCAGLIGWRALRIAGDGHRIGLYGFGAAAHILAQIAAWQGREVYAFTKADDGAGQAFARELGCVWAGDSDTRPPVLLDATIIFAPVGPLVPKALQAVRKGGKVVCAGIHMSDIPAFPYADLWGEREICSVANLTREDGRTFFEIVERAAVRTVTHGFALDDANEALKAVRDGNLNGAAVILPGRDPS